MKIISKRMTAGIMSVILVFAVFMTVLTVSVAAQTPVINTANGMFVACFDTKIRDQGNTNGDLLESISKGAYRYSRTERSGTYEYSRTEWMRLNTSGGVNGYIRCDMVCPTDRCYRVTASSGLNLRATSSTTSTVKAVIPYGEYVQVLEVRGSVSKVVVRTDVYTSESLEGMEGWVANSYITRVCSIEQGV